LGQIGGSRPSQLRRFVSQADFGAGLISALKALTAIGP
jgi:hypothetical protein